MKNVVAIGRSDQPAEDSTPLETYNSAIVCLVRAIQELSLARDMAAIQQIVRTAARQITACDGATFVLRENGFCYYADEDAIAPLWKGKRFPMEICISGWAMINRKAASIADIYADPRIPHEAYRPTFVRSLVMVPIRSLNPIGAIGNYWARPHWPTNTEVELLQTLADSTAIAMENVRVHDELEHRVQERTAELERAKADIENLSLTDELTGLNNRRGFYVRSIQAMASSVRRKPYCALAFVDVDGLKKVNDALGHDAGDSLITDMAHILRATCRQGDIIGRFGGDEFCVLFIDIEAETEPDELSRRINAKITEYNSVHARPYTVSASIGVTSFYNDESLSLDTVIANADVLMYKQKKVKNRLRRSQQ